MNKDKLASVLNMLANKEKPMHISQQLNISSRTVYEIIRDFPLFGGFVSENHSNLKKLRKKQ